MANPALGTRRRCAGCGAAFYDLGRDPIVCPICQAVFVVAAPPPKRPPRAPRWKPRPAEVAPAQEVSEEAAVPLLEEESAEEEKEGVAEPDEEVR